MWTKKRKKELLPFPNICVRKCFSFGMKDKIYNDLSHLHKLHILIMFSHVNLVFLHFSRNCHFQNKHIVWIFAASNAKNKELKTPLCCSACSCFLIVQEVKNSLPDRYLYVKIRFNYAKTIRSINMYNIDINISSYINKKKIQCLSLIELISLNKDKND